MMLDGTRKDPEDDAKRRLAACTSTSYLEPKPPFPYDTGRKLLIRPHTPPAPLKRDRHLTAITRLERREKTPLQRCYIHSPLDGWTESAILRLEILSRTRADDGYRSQVVAVKILEDSGYIPGFASQDVAMVAKFYDPLYWDHRDDETDPFISVDCSYAHEVAAYRAMATLQGSVVPRFYGSYTCDMETPDGGLRPVRLVLLGCVPGAPMSRLDPVLLNQVERQSLMKCLVEAETSLYARGLAHDLKARHIIVQYRAGETPPACVVLIDFTRAEVGQAGPDSGSQHARDMLPGTAVSPFLRWHRPRWSRYFGGLTKWVDWDWQPWLESHWPGTDPSVTERLRSANPPPSLVEQSQSPAPTDEAPEDAMQVDQADDVSGSNPAKKRTREDDDGGAAEAHPKRPLMDTTSENPNALRADQEMLPVDAAPASRADGEPDSTQTPAAQPNDRKRGKQQFEEPFKYLAADHAELDSIWAFYDISPKFPRDRFLVRNATGEPNKAIYYTAGLARDILTENEGKSVKFVHSGVKMFVSQDVQRLNTCRWRIQMEGVSIIEPWLGDKRTVKLCRRDTLKKLLVEMFPKISHESWKELGEIGERVRDIDPGCCVLRIEASDDPNGFRYVVS